VSLRLIVRGERVVVCRGFHDVSACQNMALCASTCISYFTSTTPNQTTSSINRIIIRYIPWCLARTPLLLPNTDTHVYRLIRQFRGNSSLAGPVDADRLIFEVDVLSSVENCMTIRGCEVQKDPFRVVSIIGCSESCQRHSYSSEA
jgi:hypothetical protein